MTTFLIVAAVLLLAAVVPVAYPLIRPREPGSEDQQGDVVALGRERLRELKQQRQNGDISDSEYQERVGDLEAQLADDLNSQGTTSPARARRSGRWAGIATVLVIPALSGALYLELGQPRVLTDPPQSRGASADTAAGDLDPEQIDAMVTQLADRLEDNPGDTEGWFMLARSYMVLQRYEKAAGAFSRLRALVGDTPDLLVREATAIAMANGGALAGEPRRLVQRAIEQQPDNAHALWMAATAAYQSGDYPTALDYYRRVAPMLDGEQLRQVREMIEDLSRRSGGQQAATGSRGSTDPETTAAGASLQVRVALAAALRDEVAGGDTVFIFARAVDGPPMPLAAVRRQVRDLPVTVTLDDSRAMAPQAKLSGFDRVTVGARISRSGEPVAQPGDLEGESAPVATDGKQTVAVTIDRVVPDGE